MFGKREKFSNIAPKFPFGVWIVIKSYIVVIGLIYFSSVGIVISGPSIVECLSATPRNEGSKFCDSNLQIRENSTQSWFDTKLRRPLSGLWIKARESFENCTAEFYRSSTPSVQFPNMEQRPSSNQCSNQCSSDSSKNMDWHPEDFQWVPFAGLIPIIMFLIDSLYRIAHPNIGDSKEP